MQAPWTLLLRIISNHKITTSHRLVQQEEGKRSSFITNKKLRRISMMHGLFNKTPPKEHASSAHILIGYIDISEVKGINVQEHLQGQIQEFGNCKIYKLVHDFIAIKFPDESSKIKVLEHGQLFIKDKPLILKRWNPELALIPSAFLGSLPIWVRFINLNWAYWGTESLSKLASIIGTPLFMDTCTSTNGRLDYARVCISVNIYEKLPDTIHMLRNGEIIPLSVEYEWKPSHILLSFQNG